MQKLEKLFGKTFKTIPSVKSRFPQFSIALAMIKKLQNFHNTKSWETVIHR